MRQNYVVLDAIGREVTTWTGEVERGDKVTSALSGDRRYITIVRNGAVVARGDVGNRNPRTFRFLRRQVLESKRTFDGT